jgi:uncharacterized protein YndB with AHSA1/START domain
MSADGQIQQQTAVRFERLLPGPIERVWDYLTCGEHIAAWFGGGPQKFSMEPRTGGTIDFADGHIRGVVTQWKPPLLLAYTWNVFMPGDTESPYPVSYVTFELQIQGTEVLLILTHHPVIEGFAAQTMMGWHTFLDLLGALLRDEAPETREVVMQRNKARYGVKEIKR